MSNPHPRGDAASGGQADGPHTSDLSRRIAERRRELGLSCEEVARRAGIDPTYLDYVERSTDAEVGSGALMELAKALETTPSSLAGGDVDRPPGRGRAGPRPVVGTLTRAQCEDHLRPGGVGHVVFVAERGPVVLPVNYRLDGDRVVFRTAASTSIGKAVGSLVGFEVDHIDEATSEGWSVLVTGRARRAEAGEHARLVRLGIEPWAGGYRDTFICIEIDEISGRTIRQG